MKKIHSLLLVSTLGVSLLAGLVTFSKKNTVGEVHAATKNITVTPQDLANRGNWKVDDYANIDRSGTTKSGITFAGQGARWHEDGMRFSDGCTFTVSSDKYVFTKVVFNFYAGYNVDFTEKLADDYDGANIKSHKNSYKQGYWQEETPKSSVTGMVIDGPYSDFIIVEKMVITVIAPEYTVTYDANGGSGETVDPTKWVEDSNATLIASTFTAPEGKAFSKWNTKADGTGTSYSVGAKVKMTGNLTLYAQYLNKMTVNASGYTGGYDGESHNAPVNVTVPAEGALIKYGNSETTINLSECPEFNEIGEHTVWYKVTASGYADVVGSFVINITENDKTGLNKAIESGNKLHELIKDNYHEIDTALLAAIEEATVCKDDSHALANDIATKTAAINSIAVDAIEKIINAIGEVKANDEASKQKVDYATEAYNSLSEEQKGLIPAATLSTLEAARKTVYQEGLGVGAIIGIVLGSLVVLLALVYVLLFFVFNKWIKKEDKAIRAIKLGKKGEEVRLLVMPCKVEYRKENEVYNSKAEALK